ncbi:zinc finger MYM-type protein 1-like [Salvia splendens]|uniref:zinc finger MYM-type protein 1-like n=1 Tax=Salvia splendens TaxID=180675 RepID=UPI001C255D69|nr:zinc finger MYM-type protein 1-like [Salvia splendens]
MENQPRREVGVNLNDIVGDPGKRKPIEEFDVSIRDRKSDKGGRQSDDAFTKTGCSNWKNALERFNYHVGGVNSCHNNARIQFEAFQDQRNSVESILRSNTREMEVAYRIRLTVSLNVTRFLLKQGLSFRGHDESSSSSNRGNFIELLLWFSGLNDDVSKTLFANAPANNQMNSPRIQKELANACASEVTLAIVNDIGDKVFTLLVDEARDVSMKEQMGVVLRYVNNEGYVIEQFIGIVHVTDTSSHTLKCAIDDLLVKHNLSLSKVRGQGYDGASNMRGEFNGLKSLILQENPYAMYIHCFSHQLQLIIVAVAKGIRVVKDVFSYVTMSP